MKAKYGRTKKNLASVFSKFQDSHSSAKTKSTNEGENVLCDRTVYYTDNYSKQVTERQQIKKIMLSRCVSTSSGHRTVMY